jgi:hypothetical protein
MQYASSEELAGTLLECHKRKSSKLSYGSESLADLFGYFEDSESNTMALVRKVSGFSL